MGSLGIVFIIFVVILIILALLVNKEIEENIGIYENGLRIRYNWEGIKESYNLYYKENKGFNDVLTKEEVIKLFKDLNVPVISFEEKHIVIPWEAVIYWKYDRDIKVRFLSKVRSYARDKIIFNIAKIPKELVVNTATDIGYKEVLHAACKKYASDKEINSYKVPVSTIVCICLFILYIIYCILKINIS